MFVQNDFTHQKIKVDKLFKNKKYIMYTNLVKKFTDFIITPIGYMHSQWIYHLYLLRSLGLPKIEYLGVPSAPCLVKFFSMLYFGPIPILFLKTEMK